MSLGAPLVSGTQQYCQRNADQYLDLRSFFVHVYSGRLLPALIITFDLPRKSNSLKLDAARRFLRAASFLSSSRSIKAEVCVPAASVTDTVALLAPVVSPAVAQSRR